MVDNLTKCSACSGRGYHHCDCWPGDCICGYGDEPCEECAGDGFIDGSDDYLDPIAVPCAHCGAVAVTNLDDEWLCQEHANEWVRGEGMAAAEMDEAAPLS